MYNLTVPHRLERTKTLVPVPTTININKRVTPERVVPPNKQRSIDSIHPKRGEKKKGPKQEQQKHIGRSPNKQKSAAGGPNVIGRDAHGFQEIRQLALLNPSLNILQGVRLPWLRVKTKQVTSLGIVTSRPEKNIDKAHNTLIYTTQKYPTINKANSNKTPKTARNVLH